MLFVEVRGEEDIFLFLFEFRLFDSGFWLIPCSDRLGGIICWLDLSARPSVSRTLSNKSQPEKETSYILIVPYL